MKQNECFIRTGISFLRVLEARKSKAKVLASGEWCLAVFLHGRRQKDEPEQLLYTKAKKEDRTSSYLAVTSIGTVINSWEWSSLDLNNPLPKVFHPNTISLEIKFLHLSLSPYQKLSFIQVGYVISRSGISLDIYVAWHNPPPHRVICP